MDTLPSPIDPTRFLNAKVEEPIPFNYNVRMIPQSVFNTKASFFDIVQALWWPSQIPWEEAHPAEGGQPYGFPAQPGLVNRSDVPIGYAQMPKGKMTPISQRMNIRQPRPLSLGGVQFLSQDEGDNDNVGGSA